MENGRVVHAGEGSELKIWKPVAHSPDSRGGNLPCHTRGAALRSTGAGGAEGLCVGTDSDQGRASVGHREATAQAGQQNACPDVRVLALLEGWRGLSVGLAWPHKWPCSPLLSALQERPGQLGTVRPSRKSWPGAPVKGIHVWRPML